MLSNTMSFTAIVNNNYLSISHHCGQLHINDVTIDMPYDICSLSISKNKTPLQFAEGLKSLIMMKK